MIDLKSNERLLSFFEFSKQIVPRVTVNDILRRYKGTDGIYISFVSIPKLGINPQSKYDTPNGIYCYNIKNSWSFYDLQAENPIESLPFATDAKQAVVFKVKDKYKKNIIDPNRTDLDLKAIVDDILNPVLKKYAFEDWEIEEIKDGLDFDITPKVKVLWDLGYVLKSKIKEKKIEAAYARSEERGEETFYAPNINEANIWNNIYRSVEIYGFEDTQYGYIHENEKCQAVFFTKSVLDIIGLYNNVLDKTELTETELEKNKFYSNFAKYMAKNKYRLYKEYIKTEELTPEESIDQYYSETFSIFAITSFVDDEDFENSPSYSFYKQKVEKHDNSSNEAIRFLALDEKFGDFDKKQGLKALQSGKFKEYYDKAAELLLNKAIAMDLFDDCKVGPSLSFLNKLFTGGYYSVFMKVINHFIVELKKNLEPNNLDSFYINSTADALFIHWVMTHPKIKKYKATILSRCAYFTKLIKKVDEAELRGNKQHEKLKQLYNTFITGEDSWVKISKTNNTIKFSLVSNGMSLSIVKESDTTHFAVFDFKNSRITPDFVVLIDAILHLDIDYKVLIFIEDGKIITKNNTFGEFEINSKTLLSYIFHTQLIQSHKVNKRVIYDSFWLTDNVSTYSLSVLNKAGLRKNSIEIE